MINKKYTKNNLGKFLVILILTIGGIFMLMPFIWMILTSFKMEKEAILMPPTFLPKKFTIDNYVKLFSELDFFIYFKNTLIVVFFSFIGMFSNAMAGYAFAKFRFPGKNILFYVILATMMIPG